jgi:uncharacterized protein (UPF0332 family)
MPQTTTDRLLQRGLIRRQKISWPEIEAVIERAHRDIRTGRGLLGDDNDWALAIAHNASLQAGRALMFADGFRPTARQGHKTVFEYLASEMSAHRDLIGYLDRIRVKRNVAVYGSVGEVSAVEAEQALRRAEQLLDLIEDRLRRRDGRA